MVSAPAKPLLADARYLPHGGPVAAKSSLPKASQPAPTALGALRPSDDHYLIEVIRKRPDFLRANRGKRFVTPSFVLLAYKRQDGHPVAADSIRYGITVTKKIGNAVARNRMKRRVRALIAETLSQHGLCGVDHIFIGRKQDAERPFSALKTDLERGLRHLAKKL